MICAACRRGFHATAFVLAAAFSAGPAFMPAHVSAQRHEATLEASFVRGTLGYARADGPGDRVLLGAEIGFGFAELDRMLVPGKDELTGEPDFREYLHVGLFTRTRVNPRFELDTGLRAGFADLYGCYASDCWPSPFGGAYIQPMIGWERVKLGARVSTVWVGEQEGSIDGTTFVAALTPLIVRISLRW